MRILIQLSGHIAQAEIQLIVRQCDTQLGTGPVLTDNPHVRELCFLVMGMANLLSPVAYCATLKGRDGF